MGCILNPTARLELAECLDSLTPRQREAVALWASGMTHREVGDVLGISAKSAYYLVQRGLRRYKAAYLEGDKQD